MIRPRAGTAFLLGDVLEADDAYTEAMRVPEAVAELRRGSGTQFDPVVVDALVRSL